MASASRPVRLVMSDEERSPGIASIPLSGTTCATDSEIKAPTVCLGGNSNGSKKIFWQQKVRQSRVETRRKCDAAGQEGNSQVGKERQDRQKPEAGDSNRAFRGEKEGSESPSQIRRTEAFQWQKELRRKKELGGKETLERKKAVKQVGSIGRTRLIAELSCVVGADHAANTPAGSPLTISVLGQIILQLPRRDLGDVVLPLLTLRGQKLVRDVLAKRFDDDGVFLQLVAGFLEVARQIVDPQPAPLAM